MTYKKVDIQVMDPVSGNWRTVIGADMPEEQISFRVMGIKRGYPDRRVRAIDRSTKAVLDIQ